MSVALRQRLVAEAFGTFWIVFAGTGAIIVGDISGAITHIGVALVFGLVVFVMIAALGDISGAHFNPAVTLGFCLARRLPLGLVLPYVVSQVFGALLASTLLRWLFPDHASLGATHPTGTFLQSWVLEFALTLGLMFVILCVSTGAAEKGITAGLAIGALIALEALFAGPISGASMNPARSLAPALVGGELNNLMLYLTAPFAGAACAVPVCLCAREKSCCAGAADERC